MNTSQAGGVHRCFFAVRFAPHIEEYLARLIADLRRHGGGVRWVPRENLHLTLRFLGEITDSQLEHAMGMPDLGGLHGPFTVRARGLGAFPLMRAPRVLWAGVEGETQRDTDHLLSLQKHTERWAGELGLVPERRSYSPHITLGRVTPPFDGLKKLMDDVIGRECLSGYGTVEELLLMRSKLSGGPAAYEVARRWRLG